MNVGENLTALPATNELRASTTVEEAGAALAKKILELNDAHAYTRYNPGFIITASLLASSVEIISGTLGLALTLQEQQERYVSTLWRAPLEGALASEHFWDFPGQTLTAFGLDFLDNVQRDFLEDATIAIQTGQMLLGLLIFRKRLGQEILDGTLVEKIKAAPTQATHAEILEPMTIGTVLFYTGESALSSFGLLGKETAAATSTFALEKTRPAELATTSPRMASIPWEDGVELLMPKRPPPRFVPPPNPPPTVVELPRGRASSVGDFDFVGEGPSPRMFKRVWRGLWQETPKAAYADPTMAAVFEELFGFKHEQPLARVPTRTPIRVPLADAAVSVATRRPPTMLTMAPLDVEGAVIPQAPLRVLDPQMQLAGPLLNPGLQEPLVVALGQHAAAMTGARPVHRELALLDAPPAEGTPADAVTTAPVRTLFVLHGKIVVLNRGPDGDTIFFVIDEFPEELKGFLDSIPGWAHIKMTNGAIAIRMDFIDALETHFRGRRQNTALGDAATDALLAKLGITGVHWRNHLPPKDGERFRIDRANDGVPAWLLVSSVERFGRAVGCLMTEGKAAQLSPERRLVHGTTTPFDLELLGLTVNWEMIQDDQAYPAFYSGLPPHIRGAVAMLARDRSQLGGGIWADDVTTQTTPIRSIGEASALAMFPKPFRRMVGAVPFGDPTQPVPQFMHFVKGHLDNNPDYVFLLGADELAAPLDGRTPILMTDPGILEIDKTNNTIRFLVPPWQLVFVEK